MTNSTIISANRNVRISIEGETRHEEERKGMIIDPIESRSN